MLSFVLQLALVLSAVLATAAPLDESNELLDPLPSNDKNATSHDRRGVVSNLSERATSYQGRGTYFYPGLGACGTTVGNSAAIVALNVVQYGALDRISPSCFKWIQITNTENGKTTTAMIQDACPSCAWGGLDLSPSVFQKIAAGGLGEGVIPLSWYFLDNPPKPSHTSVAPKKTPKPTKSKSQQTSSKTSSASSTSSRPPNSSSPTSQPTSSVPSTTHSLSSTSSTGLPSPTLIGNAQRVGNLILRLGNIASLGRQLGTADHGRTSSVGQ